ncbi:MAG: PAS domain-containing protein [Planctomycetota bacterium]
MPTEPSPAASEPDFKRLIEGLSDVIWSTGAEGTFGYLSPQFKTVFGFEPEDWIGRSPIELVHPDDRKAFEQSCTRENEHQEQTSIEFRHLCQDGSYTWVLANSVAVIGEEGNTICRQGTIRDISERKRMEKEKDRLVRILQSTSDFVGICKPEVGILWQNKPFQELRPDLVIEEQNVPITELYPDWAREIVVNEGLSTAIDRGVWSGETALLDSSGNEIPTSQVIIAHKSDDGEVEYFSTILRDISKIRATEQELRSAQAELRSTSENVPGVIYRTLFQSDGSHRFAYVSPSFRNMFGLEPDESLKDADEFWTRIHPDDLHQVRQKSQQSMETGEPYHANYRLRHDEKGMRWYGSWALPSRLENGDIAFDGILIDIHDRKVAELAQRDAQVQLQSMTQNVPGVLSRLLLHPDGSRSFAYVSPNVRELFGLDPDALMEDVSDLWGRIHPDDLEDVQSRLQSSVETGEPLHTSYRLLLEERGTRWVEMWSLPSWLENGGVAYDGIAIDVTDREVAKQEQREAQSHLLSATKNIPGVIYRWVQHPDGTRNLAYVSPNIRQVYGIEPHELMSDDNETWRRIPPEDLEEIDRKFNLGAVTLEPYQMVHRYILDDNNTRWIETWALPSRQDNGDVFFDGIAIDITQRKAEETEQGKAQAELVATTENVPGVIFRAVVRVDGSQQMTYVSPSLRELLGIDSEALLADMNELWKRIHPEDVAEVERRMRESMELLVPYRSVHRVIVEGRGTRWIESSSLPTRLENGDVVFNGIATDITERKAEELKQSEAQSQLRDMTENVPGVISRIVVSPDGSQRVAYVSPRVRELFGLDPDALSEDISHVWSRIHPDDVAEVENKMLRSVETLEPNHVSYRLVLEKKGTRWVEAWSLPSRQENGDIVFNGIVMDVTDLGRLGSLERDINFRRIFDNAPHAVFLIEADEEHKGRIAAANKAAERMQCYEVGELIGKQIMDLDDPDAARKASGRLERLAQGEELLFEVNHVHKTGRVFPVEVTASRILIDGRVYVLAFDRDLTDSRRAEAERRELQDKLIQSQKLEAVGQLAAGIAHEFNNIIASVSANTQLVLGFHRNEIPTHVLQPLEAIDEACERAAGLTRQLLSIVRKKRTDVSTFDLNRLVKKQINLLRPLLGDGVVLQSRLTDRGAWVRANEYELENALLNLCLNARDAVGGQGEIAIETKLIELDQGGVPVGFRSGAFVRLSVCDNGCGISEEEQRRIFEPFVTTKLAGRGTGLGLSIVATNVANCDGFVTVESQLKRGSTFHIHLPLVESQELKASSGGAKQPFIESGNCGTILVCDDDPMVLRAMSRLIEALGYQVIAVDSAGKAVEAMKAHPEIALLLTDISMPETTGLELGLILKQIKPDLEVICTSGYGEEFLAPIEDVQFDFIAKPVSASELSKKIRSTLGRNS